jgi:hypothetical protein
VFAGFRIIFIGVIIANFPQEQTQMKGFKPNFIRTPGLIMLVSIVLVIGLAAVINQPAQARSNASLPESAPPAPGAPADNEACLACHIAPDKVMTFPDGDAISVVINQATFDTSVHNKLTCTTCHTTFNGYPHPARTAQTGRAYTLQYKETCKNCHTDKFNQIQDSVHSKALAVGNQNAPFCSDCHNPHTQVRINDEKGNLLLAARAQVPHTCAKCHSTLFDQYANSVHGKGVLEADNPDVPTCITCHGVHQITDPTTAAFRLSSIQLCASCHTNALVMDKYGISTQVLNTYVSDFHGTTATLFEHQSPNEMTNKPVCYDCHGIHNIVSVNDPQKGLSVKENILIACKKCHPDASSNFPDSWLSHYIPSPSKYPVVFYVNLFYQILVPLVLGGMGAFVLTDIYRQAIVRRKSHKS